MFAARQSCDAHTRSQFLFSEHKLLHCCDSFVVAFFRFVVWLTHFSACINVSSPHVLLLWVMLCPFCLFVCLVVCLVVCLFVCLFGWLVGQWSRPPCAHMPGCCFCFSKPFAPLHCCVQLHRSVDAEHLLRSRGKGAFLIKLCTSNPDAAFNLGTRQCFCLSVCVQ